MFPPRMKRLFTTSIFLVIAASVFFVHQASALTVSPAKIEVAGDPGSVLKGTIRVYNEQEKEQTLYTSFENFEPNDDSGTPRFIGAEGGLATWFTAEPTLTVGAAEETELTYRISIPMASGGYSWNTEISNTRMPAGICISTVREGRYGFIPTAFPSTLTARQWFCPVLGSITKRCGRGMKAASSEKISVTRRNCSCGGGRTTSPSNLQH